MLITSLILLLLSSGMTFRRDKSILYFRFTIILKLYVNLLCYDSLFIAFLSNKIGLYVTLSSLLTLLILIFMLHMLITSLILLLLSSGMTFRRDKSILYFRFTIILKLYVNLLCYDSLFIAFLSNKIGLYVRLSSLLTLIILIFMLIPEEWLKLVSILSLMISNE